MPTRLAADDELPQGEFCRVPSIVMGWAAYGGVAHVVRRGYEGSDPPQAECPERV